MKPIVADTDDRRWQAVCERDTRADGQFVFAVLTTGICLFLFLHPKTRYLGIWRTINLKSVPTP